MRLTEASGRDARRDERWEIRRRLRSVLRSKRVRACGRPGLREDGSVVVEARADAAEGRTHEAGYSGLFACGSVWLCGHCSLRIAARRAEELERVMAVLVARGSYPVLVTLTMRHHRGHSLAECIAGSAKGWRAVVTGRAWQDHKAMSGYQGYVRALEVTESPENGWHVHHHVLVVFDHEPSPDVLDTVTGGMFARWSAGLVRAGMPAPSLAHGLDVQRPAGDRPLLESAVAAARYIVKGLATEAVMGVAKEAKGRNRSIRQLMRDAVIPQPIECPQTGELVDVVDVTAQAKLLEYEAAMQGRRQLNWSRGDHDLRVLAGVAEDEISDEEIVAGEETDRDPVAVIPRESWPTVEPRAAELLGVIERRGPEAGRRWLDALGVEWWRPTALTDQRRRGEPPGGR